MALVEVPGRGLDAQGAQCPHAADAQHQLLVEAHLAAADVQDVGDRAVGARCRDVRVKEQDRHAPDLPTQTAAQVPTWELDADRERVAVAVEDAQDGRRARS